MEGDVKRNRRLRVAAAVIYIPALTILWCDLFEVGDVSVWFGIALSWSPPCWASSVLSHRQKSNFV